jgi:hypothetical protein
MNLVAKFGGDILQVNAVLASVSVKFNMTSCFPYSQILDKPEKLTIEIHSSFFTLVATNVIILYRGAK